MSLNNQKAIELQKKIILLSNNYMTKKQEHEFEKANDDFAEELKWLPKEGKQLDNNGMLISWSAGKNKYGGA